MSLDSIKILAICYGLSPLHVAVCCQPQFVNLGDELQTC